MAPPAPAAATLDFLQEQIQAMNAVRAPPVLGYLVERAGARASGAEPRASEELLVLEVEDGVEVGLFLDDGVLVAAAAAAAHRGGARMLARPNLEGITAAAEGISHFVYLATRAEEGRRMSLLELELQAEVDKFAVLLLQLWRRGRRRLGRLSAALRRRLYEDVRFLAHLDGQEVERYRTANRLASGYARWLELRFVAPGDREGFLRELRATYRLGTAEKPGYLASRG
jgi:hypothetical protein